MEAIAINFSPLTVISRKFEYILWKGLFSFGINFNEHLRQRLSLAILRSGTFPYRHGGTYEVHPVLLEEFHQSA